MTTINNGDVEVVSIIAKYEEATAIIKEILQYDETSIDFISLFSEDMTDYDREYIISIDDNFVIWCDEMYDYDDDDYVYFETDKVYIMDDCDKNAVNHINEEDINVVIYSDDIDSVDVELNNSSFDDENGLKMSVWNNDDYFGFTISDFDDENNYHTFSYYSKDKLNFDKIRKILGV